MRKIIIFLILILLVNFAFAELDEFPDNFMTGNKFDGYIVVGKEGSSLDVLGQNLIGMKINLYAGSPQAGINKLDDEADLDDNLILIGNPCVNELTAELLDNPEPCDNDFPVGKSFIRYYEKDGNKYIVVAGYSDKGNKKAAEYLADFEQNDLSGDEIVLEVEDLPAEKKSVGFPPGGIVAPPPLGVDADSPGKDIEPVQISEPKISAPVPGQEIKKEEPGEVEDQSNIIVVEKKGVFARIWGWVLSLFGK